MADAIDVVWLKKDLRLHDHGPLSLISRGRGNRQCIIIYLYEPDQLGEKSVHGSHVAFVNEGLVDLDLKLSGEENIFCKTVSSGGTINNQNIIQQVSGEIYRHEFKCITVCHAGAAFTFSSIHKQRPIHQILCHMESGHLKSFSRDKQVRRWCRANNVPIREYDQTGVTRCLRNRDDFSKNFHKFLNQKIWVTPTESELAQMRQFRLLDLEKEQIKLHGKCNTPINPADLCEIPIEHRGDRIERQYGGETKALETFNSFLSHRGANYSSGISSPNTSWTTGSRLSPYLTWGNISLRYVIVITRERQEELRAAQKKKSGPTPVKNNPWLRSLASFQSRMHWRSHFIQKLETQPSLECQDQCLAFSQLRRQPGDFNQQYYDAWREGRTGFPFVDACMRCLIRCGWVNFRMRAMLVSFATYNLWLDWKKIAGHLARVFLDYEPGIHYPQLQMQAGTTGINAMRVYNVTKQGKDQDPNGVFIKRHCPELKGVPLEYIHEPCNMPLSVQKKVGVIIGGSKSNRYGITDAMTSSCSDLVQNEKSDCSVTFYPSPIVDERKTAKAAKDKLSAVRKQESTKREAVQVYLKHGSRRSPGQRDRDDVMPKALSSSVKRVKMDTGQKSLAHSWKNLSQEQSTKCNDVEVARNCKSEDIICLDDVDDDGEDGISAASVNQKVSVEDLTNQKSPSKSSTNKSSSYVPPKADNKVEESDLKQWSCKACTFLNEKPFALVCSMCGTLRD